MYAVVVYYQDSLDKLEGELEVGLSLALTYGHKSCWVLANKVLENDTNLTKVLVSESTVDIICVSCNYVEHLW